MAGVVRVGLNLVAFNYPVILYGVYTLEPCITVRLNTVLHWLGFGNSEGRFELVDWCGQINCPLQGSLFHV